MKFLRTAIIIIAIILASYGCLTGTGSGAGSPAGAPGNGLIPGPASGFAGPGEGADFGGGGDGSGAAGDVASDPDDAGGGGLDTGPDDVTSDTPITVVGTPLGMIPRDDCFPAGSEISFGDTEMAITGEMDALGRSVIQVRTQVRVLRESAAPTSLGARKVVFSNPNVPEEVYGASAPQGQCVFARLHAPPEATGAVVRLWASIPICGPELPDARPPTEAAVLYSTSSSLKLGGTTFVTGFSDIVIPQTTADSFLEECSEPEPQPAILDPYPVDGMMLRR